MPESTGANPGRLDPADLMTWKRAIEDHLGPLVNQADKRDGSLDDGWVFGVEHFMGVWVWTHERLEGCIAATWYWTGEPQIPVDWQKDDGTTDVLAVIEMEATGDPEADAKIYYHLMRPVLARAIQPSRRSCMEMDQNPEPEVSK